MTTNSENILENEITLVTGASRGIGAGIAKLFGQSGSYVLGTATTQNGADSISELFSKDGVNGQGVVLDVSDSENVKKVM